MWKGRLRKLRSVEARRGWHAIPARAQEARGRLLALCQAAGAHVAAPAKREGVGGRPGVNLHRNPATLC